jgi:hypothetical protein
LVLGSEPKILLTFVRANNVRTKVAPPDNTDFQFQFGLIFRVGFVVFSAFDVVAMKGRGVSGDV